MQGFFKGNQDILTDEIRKVFSNNDIGKILYFESPEDISSQKSEEPCLIIVQFDTIDVPEFSELESLLGLDNAEKIRMLVFLPEKVDSYTRDLAKFQNSKVVTLPLKPARLQISLRILLTSTNYVPELKADFFHALLDSSRDVFDKHVKSPLTRKGIYPDNDFNFQESLAGSIEITGQIKGFITLCCSYESGKDLLISMTGVEEKAIDDKLIEEGLLEVLNIITGNAQALMNKLNISFDFDTPEFWDMGKQEVFEKSFARVMVFAFEFGENKAVYLNSGIK